jgi:hypothetical protein
MTTLPKPIGRFEFLARCILASVAADIGWEIILRSLQSPARWSLSLEIAFGVLMFVLWIAYLMWVIRFVIIARLVSIGASRWYAPLMFVPLANLFFLIVLLFQPAGKSPQHG